MGRNFEVCYTWFYNEKDSSKIDVSRKVFEGEVLFDCEVEEGVEKPEVIDVDFMRNLFK